MARAAVSSGSGRRENAPCQRCLCLLAAAVVLARIGLVVGPVVVGGRLDHRGCPGTPCRPGAGATAGAAASGEELEPAAAVACPGAAGPAPGSFLVVGRCVQAPGVVLPGVAVSVFAAGERSRDPLTATHSGVDGLFSLPIVPAGQLLRVELTAPGCAAGVVEQDDVAVGDRVDLGDVWLPAIARLRGEVVESSVCAACDRAAAAQRASR